MTIFVLHTAVFGCHGELVPLVRLDGEGKQLPPSSAFLAVRGHGRVGPSSSAGPSFRTHCYRRACGAPAPMRVVTVLGCRFRRTGVVQNLPAITVNASTIVRK